MSACLAVPALAEPAVAPAPPTPAPTAAERPLSLEEAIRLTLRQSNDAIRLEDEKVNGAAARLKQASGAFDWMVTGEGGYLTLYVPRVVPGPNGQGLLSNQTDSVGTGYVSGGIGRTFRNGISIRPGVTAYPNAGASVAQTLGQTQFRPSLGLSIPLLRGLGETAADAVEISAQEALKGSRLARDFAVASLVNDTVQIYWRCQAADEVARNTRDFDSQAATYDAALASLAGKGLVEPTVATRAKAMAAARHVGVVQAGNAAEDCRRDLAAATGGAVAAPAAALPAMERMAAAVEGLKEAALVDMALANRADFKAAQENVAAAEAKLGGAQDATAPSLNLALEPDRAVLRFSQSIQNSTGEGLRDEALSNLSAAKIAQSQMQSQIRQQVSITLRNLKASYADWTLLRAAAEEMDDVVKDAGGRARLGVIERSDFVTIQSQRTDIQNQMVNARLQFASSLATLRLVTGTVNPAAESADSVAAKFVSPAILP